MKSIADAIQEWLQNHADNGTLPDPRNFPFEPLAMTTNGTSGIFRAHGREWYFYAVGITGNVRAETVSPTGRVHVEVA